LIAHEARYSHWLFIFESDGAHACDRTGRLSLTEGEGEGEGRRVQRISRVSRSNPSP
jgi:hypothetical protein